METGKQIWVQTGINFNPFYITITPSLNQDRCSYEKLVGE